MYCELPGTLDETPLVPVDRPSGDEAFGDRWWIGFCFLLHVDDLLPLRHVP